MSLTSRAAALCTAIAILGAPGWAQTAGLIGTWSAKQTTPAGATTNAPDQGTLVFSRNGNAISGVMRAGGNELPLFDLSQTGANVSFSLVIPGTPYTSLRYSGKLDGNTLSLSSADEGQGRFQLTAEREGAPVMAEAAPAPEAKPAAPTPPSSQAPAAAPAVRAPAPTASTAQAQPARPAAPQAPPTPNAAPPAAVGQAIQGSYITRLLNQLPAAPTAPAAPAAQAAPPPPSARAAVPPASSSAPLMRGAPVPSTTAAPLMQGAPVPPAQDQVATVAAPRPAPAPPALPKASFDLAGEWIAQQSSPGSAAPVDVKLSFMGEHGTMLVGKDEWPLFEVKASGDDLGFDLVIPGSPYITIHYRGTVMAGEMQLASLDEGQGVFTLSGRRADASPPATVAAKPAAPEPAPTAPAPPPARVASAEPPTATGPAPQQTSPLPAQISPPVASTAAPAPPPAPVASAAPPAAPPAPATSAAPAQVSAPPAPNPPSLPSDASAQVTTLISPVGSAARAISPEPQPPAVASLAPQPSAPAAQPAPAQAAQPRPVRVPRSFARPALTSLPAKLPLPALHDVTPNSNVFKTPPMGWASRQKHGTLIDADIIRQAADGLNESGLRAAGYTLVEVDDGWQGERDASGEINPNDNFPDMKGLADYIHGRGLKFGLFASAAPLSCSGFEGSYGHEIEDAKTFASWGVDYVIYDGCGLDAIYPTDAEQRAAFQKMGDALKASGRDIAFGVRQSGASNVASWASKTGAHLWRSGDDVSDTWKSVAEVGFAQVGKPTAAAPAGWSDPGLIQLGNAGMTTDEYRSQLNLWAMLASPMVLGSDVRMPARDTVAALTNQELIAVDQDAKGVPAKRVVQAGQTEVWSRTLADGSLIVGFFNRGESSTPVAVSWEQLGLDGPRQIRDIWWHQNIGGANGNYVVFLGPHASLLLKLSR